MHGRCVILECRKAKMCSWGSWRNRGNRSMALILPLGTRVTVLRNPVRQEFRSKRDRFMPEEVDLESLEVDDVIVVGYHMYVITKIYTSGDEILDVRTRMSHRL